MLLARFVGVGDGGALGVGLDGAFVQELAEPVTGVAVLGLHEESFEGRPADGHCWGTRVFRVRKDVA